VIPLSAEAAGPVEVLVRPEELAVEPDGDDRVRLVEFYGHDTVYVVALAGGAEVRVRRGAAPQFQRGDRVRLRYAGPATIAYPADGAPIGTSPPAAAPTREAVPTVAA
jgi:iron(III) transport system ATP-binding protein